MVACVYPLSAWYLEARLRQRTLRQTRPVERAETDVNPSYSTTLWLTDLALFWHTTEIPTGNPTLITMNLIRYPSCKVVLDISLSSFWPQTLMRSDRLCDLHRYTIDSTPGSEHSERSWSNLSFLTKCKEMIGSVSIAYGNTD